MDCEVHTRLRHTSFDTSLVEPQLRTAALRKRLCPFVDLHVMGSGPVKASFDCHELGSVLVTRFALATPSTFGRSDAATRHDPFGGHVLAIMLVHGHLRGEQEGLNFVLDPGDILMLDLAHAFSLYAGECRFFGVLVRRDVLGNHADDVRGRVLAHGKLRCRVLTLHLEHLVARLPSPSPAHARTFADATVAVLRHCFQLSPPDGAPHQPWLRDLQNRILAYIDEHLTEASLDATRVRRAFRISRAHLYRLFPDYGGVQRYIRNRRLDGAFRDLCENPEQRISQVIERNGFASERQFQRAFMERFEMTPSELRQQQRLTLQAPRKRTG